MPHSHVTVTLDADTVARIEADLDPGQSVSARLREIVERRYGEDDERWDGEDDEDGGDRDDDPFVEFVDDCAV